MTWLEWTVVLTFGPAFVGIMLMSIWEMHQRSKGPPL